MQRFIFLILSIIICVCSNSTHAQNNEIIIDSRTSIINKQPFNNNFKYSWNETIYQKDDIGISCEINSISYHRASGNPDDVQSIEIYMGETSRSYISSNTDWTPPSSLALVYSGKVITIGDSEWETFVLDTPFEYSGEKNLVIAVAKTECQYKSQLLWYNTQNDEGNCVSMYRQSNTDSSCSQYPLGFNGLCSTYAPNIILGIEKFYNPINIYNTKTINYGGYYGYSLKYQVTNITNIK